MLIEEGCLEKKPFPSSEAQADLIRSVYHTAGLDPDETTYVEAHGTGTAAGDPVEAGAIASVFTVKRTPDNPLLVGSVKSNIGHLEAASGLAAMVKTIFAMEEGVIPPNINFEKPNKDIPLEEWKLKVRLDPWISLQFQAKRNLGSEISNRMAQVFHATCIHK